MSQIPNYNIVREFVNTCYMFNPDMHISEASDVMESNMVIMTEIMKRIIELEKHEL